MLDCDNGEISTKKLVKKCCTFSWSQFYTDLDLHQQCQVLQKIEEFKDFLRHLSDFPVLFKAYLFFKDFSR